MQLRDVVIRNDGSPIRPPPEPDIRDFSVIHQVCRVSVLIWNLCCSILFQGPFKSKLERALSA